MKRTFSALVGLIVSVSASPLLGAVAQYDFNGNLNSSVGGAALATGFAAPAASVGITFSNVTINGGAAQAVSFTRGTYFKMIHGLGANGGGVYLNQYTLIMDVMFPSRPGGWAVLFQTNTNNSNDGDWFVNPSQAIGISGVYGGSVVDGTWNRLAAVVDNLGGTLTSYVNGTQVQQVSGLTFDGRWTLDPILLLFADESSDNAGGLVNSVQLRPELVSSVEIAALGGPTAAGIPVPSAPTNLTVVTPNGGENYQAGTSQTISWTAVNPNGLVQVDLYRGGVFLQSLGQTTLSASNFVWAIHPALGDTNTYRIKLTSVAYPAVTDTSDNNFSVFGSTGILNPLFGQPLQTNGGFEQTFANWQTIAGSPLVLTSAGGKGTPHGGINFFHGGIATTASNAIVRQEIDLIALGFTTNDIDTGAVLDAQAWLRNYYGAGNFDDQVFYRVGYLDGAGQELSAMRCIIAADSTWLQRNLSGPLPVGTRKLRLEVVGKLRRDTDNDSMADDLIVRLQKPFPLPTPNITKLPMLQDVRTNAMTLLWETDGNLVRPYVDWGRSNITENVLGRVETLQIDTTHFVHRATIPGLAAETSYVYRVRNGTNATPAYTFTTAPKRSSPFVTAWWGDNHDGTTTLKRHVTNLLAHAPNMICVAGDMVNSGNSLSEWHNYWFKPLETLNAAQTTPVIFTRGNHDGEHALAYAYSTLPGNESWFAFDYGNCRFIFLDTEAPTTTPTDQLAWLSAELSRPETQQAAFRIVCFHRPPYTDFWNGAIHPFEPDVVDNWVPVLTQKNVDVVICGHMHAYQRGTTNGVTYIVSGGGGGVLDTERVANWPFVVTESSSYHYDIMEVNGPVLSWETYNVNNQMLDMFSLQSRVPVLSWPNATPIGGQLPLRVSGKPGVSYALEQSTNLLNWTAIATNTIPASGAPCFTNSVPGHFAPKILSRTGYSLTRIGITERQHPMAFFGRCPANAIAITGALRYKVPMKRNGQIWDCHRGTFRDAGRSNLARGFSLIELLIVLALILILTTMYWGFSGRSYQRGKQKACQANLQKVFIAMQIYGNESGGNYPVVSNAPSSEVPLDLLVPHYTVDTATFVCPGSKDSALSSGESLRKGRISYAYYMGRKTSDANEALMSDKQIESWSKLTGQYAFSTNGRAPGNNHHQYGGNFLFSDGHVELTPPRPAFSVALPQGVVLLNPKP